MSKFKDKRDVAVHNLVPKLVSQLTGFKETQENHRRCVDYASAKIRSQNELAVNSHEIRRRMEGLCEKFDSDNYNVYSEMLKKWETGLINHPAWEDHEQVDIQWMILEFLLETSYNPVGALTKRIIANKGKLIYFAEINEDEKVEEQETLWASLLKVDEESREFSDDELSQWSDEDEDSDSVSKSEEKKEELKVVFNKPQLIYLPGIKPPQKDPHFQEFECKDSAEWLRENVQYGWWQDKNSKETTSSDFKEADFCQIWNQFLKTITFGFLAEKEFSTTSEYILLREIIWMFLCPTKKSKFFKIEQNEVKLIENISVTSSNLRIFHNVVGKIVRPLTQIYHLRKFCEDVKFPEGDKLPPISFEVYVDSLEKLLKPFENHLQEIEVKLIDKNDFTSLIKFLESLQEYHLHFLDTLYQIHISVIPNNWTETENHFCSAFLMSGLFNQLESPINEITNSLALSLLLPTLNSSLTFIDSWWSLGKLFDYRDEFFIHPETFAERPSFLSELRENELINLLSHHCIQSGQVLTHLRRMDRVFLINNFKHKSSFDDFMENFLKCVNKTETKSEETQTGDSLEPLAGNEHYCDLMELLLQDEVQSAHDEQMLKSNSMDSRAVFDLFHQSNTIFILPFQELVLRTLRNVMEPKIKQANKRIADIYLNEFDILAHFQNIRKVIFCEVSHSMFEFYTDVFRTVEDDFESLTPYVMTTKLETCLSASTFALDPDFQVEFSRDYFKSELDTVLDALDHLQIEYNCRSEFLDPGKVLIYNQVFRFLIKIKWALWMLESLKFSDNFRNKSLFHRPNMLDYSIRRLAILKYWLLSTVQNIHSYLMASVIQGESAEFERKLRQCNSLGAIQKLHNYFIKSVQSKCFLDEQNQVIGRILQQFLNFILVFRDEWHLLNSTLDKDRFSEKAATKEVLLNFKLEHLENTFYTIHELISNKLRTKVEEDNEVHLTGLAGAFLHRQPIHYQSG